MGTVIPKTRDEQLTFFETHAGVWKDHALAIGLTLAQADNFANATVAAAREAFNAAELARQASKAATQAYYQASDTLRDQGAELIRIIKTFAVTSNDPGVYTLAQIPAPAAPGTLPPPKAPVDLRGSIDNNGVLTLRWKLPADAPDSSNFFMVERRVQTTPTTFTDWTLLGGNGRREFVDPSIPGCIVSVQYRIRTQRLGQTSPNSPVFTVIYGQGGLDLVAQTRAEGGSVLVRVPQAGDSPLRAAA